MTGSLLENLPLTAAAGLLLVFIVAVVVRPLIRRLVNATVEIIATFSLLLIAIGGGIGGYIVGQNMRFTADILTPAAAINENLPTIGVVVGAFAGYLVGALVLSIIFLLSEIAANSRKTALFFDQAVTRARHEAGE